MNGNGAVMFAKYTLVGSMGLILDMASLFVFVEYVHMHVLIASALAFMISVINNFIFHKYWTFKDKSHHFKKQFVSFFVISIINLGITVFCMYIFVDVFGIWYMISKLITATIVLIWSYTANKIWTFHIKK